MYIPVAGFLAALFLIPEIPADNPIINAAANSPVLLIIPVIALVAAMYAASVWVSISVMKNKEM